MILSRQLSLVVTAVAMLGACSSSSGPGNAVEVNVSGGSFERIGTPAMATIPFSITNRGSASVFVARCDTRVMTAVDRWNGESWTDYSGDICLGINTSIPLELAPGESAIANRSIHEPGRYRLRIGALDAASGDVDWSIVSGQFEVL